MRTRADSYLRVQPKRSLVMTGFLAYLVTSVPIFGTLYLLGIPNGSGLIVLALQLVSGVLALIGYLLYRHTFIGITPDSIVERTYFGTLQTTPLSSIATISLVDTYRVSSSDTTPQLFAANESGERMLRMRGTFWSKTSMLKVAEAIDREVITVEDPITPTELFRRYPGSRYWFEVRTVASASALIAAFLVGLAALVTAMSLTGIQLDPFR